jgi:hypothetical protein
MPEPTAARTATALARKINQFRNDSAGERDLYPLIVRLSAGSPAFIFSGILFLSAALTALALWVYAHAETPFDYMVMGTFGATAALAMVFFFLVRRKLL